MSHAFAPMCEDHLVPLRFGKTSEEISALCPEGCGFHGYAYQACPPRDGSTDLRCPRHGEAVSGR